MRHALWILGLAVFWIVINISYARFVWEPAWIASYSYDTSLYDAAAWGLSIVSFPYTALLHGLNLSFHPAWFLSTSLIWGATAYSLFQLSRKTIFASRVSASNPLSLDESRLLIKKAKTSRALVGLNQIKAQRQPVRDVDYLRALCFANEKQPIAAIEALKEELRFFRDNQPAAELLETLVAKHQGECSIEDSEFREIFNAVRPYTMLGEARLYSLFRLAKELCEQDVPGNFVECGVAAGGSSALLAAVIDRYTRQPRRLFSFDTFEGMPAASTFDISHGKSAEATGWSTGTCAAPESSLREVCQNLGVEKLVEPIKGLFADTLPQHRERIGAIAFLHLDGDWYASTRDILENLFDQVVAGGRIQIDDYGHWEGCRRAVSEFEKARGLKFEMTQIDETGIWLPR